MQQLMQSSGLLAELAAAVADQTSGEDEVLVALKGIVVVCRFNRPAQNAVGAQPALLTSIFRRLCGSAAAPSNDLSNSHRVQIWCVHALFVVLVNNADNQTALLQRHAEVERLRASLEAMATSDAWSSWPHNEARVVLTLLGFSTMG